uniref:Potassium channel tetramerization domain containing 4 n=1 Tax=Hucho hucho TaxID=62062 RepID=A0A4W5RRC5_9TELE
MVCSTHLTAENLYSRDTYTTTVSFTPTSTITLNVGGFLYAAHRTTLSRHQGSVLEELASGKKTVQHTDSMGNPFIDRDGPVFRHILNFLRTGDLQLPDDFREVGLLRREAEFYRLSRLVEAILESQGFKVYCSDPTFIDKVKSRLVQISKSRLDGFPEEFEVSSNVIQFRHFIKSEPGSRLVLKQDSTFVCTLELTMCSLHDYLVKYYRHIASAKWFGIFFPQHMEFVFILLYSTRGLGNTVHSESIQTPSFFHIVLRFSLIIKLLKLIVFLINLHIIPHNVKAKTVFFFIQN